MTYKLPTVKPKLALWVLLIAVFLAVVQYFNLPELLRTSLVWIGGLGPWGGVAFIALYILATILFIPGSILTLGAGFLFGILHGSIYVSVAATVGAVMAFLIGRYWARQWVSKRIEGNERFTAVDEAVATLGMEGRSRPPAEWILYVIGLIATVAVTVYITQIARKALEEKVS